jgi:hypothetical protein
MSKKHREEFTLGSIPNGVTMTQKRTDVVSQETTSQHRHLGTPELEFRLALRTSSIGKLEEAQRRTQEEIDGLKARLRAQSERLEDAKAEHAAIKTIIASRG